MARNGSGVYSLPAAASVATGDTIEAGDWNTTFQDIETDLNTARPVVAGGTGATTAANARTNLGVGSGDSPTFSGLTLTGSVASATYGSWSSSDTAIDALLPGSQYGTLIQSETNGHFVIGLRGNDANDQFAIIGYDGAGGTSYDAKLFSVDLNGDIELGANASVNADGDIDGTDYTGVNASFTGTLTITATTPSVILSESDGTSTHNETWLLNASNNFELQTRQSDGTAVSTDYRVTKNSSGASAHDWYLGGVSYLQLDATAMTYSETAPVFNLRETDGTTTHNTTALVQSGDIFSIQTRDNSEALVASDYAITKGSSGATEHSFRIGGNERFEITNTGTRSYNGSAMSPVITGTVVQTIASLENNTATTITAPQGKGIMAVYYTSANTSGLFLYSVSGSAFLTTIVAGGTLSNEGVGALTGTDGTALSLNIGVTNAGVVYFENQVGATLTNIEIRFLDGFDQ